jgi:hypothetical protein
MRKGQLRDSIEQGGKGRMGDQRGTEEKEEGKYEEEGSEEQERKGVGDR